MEGIMKRGIESPLTFDLYKTGQQSIVLVNRLIKERFGPENYRLFKEAGRSAAKLGLRRPVISEEDRQRVDRRVYDEFGLAFGVEAHLRESLWRRSISLGGIGTVNYARRILYPDQEKRATLTTDITSDDWRPASALEILTMPTKMISPVCKYEQAVVLGFTLLAGELIAETDSSSLRAILKDLHNFFTDYLFLDRKGETTDYHIYSYHRPKTNELVGLGKTADPPEQGLSVKSLSYPARKLRIIDSEMQVREVLALYEPREKEIGSAVLKAKERSLQESKKPFSNGTIEITPYRSDYFGFQFVVMEGGRPMRDLVIRNLEVLMRLVYGDLVNIKPKDKVKSSHGSPDRVQFRRDEVTIKRLDQSIEIIVYDLKDYIASEYEIGKFDERLNRHDGPMRSLYKLDIVGDVAGYIWPYVLFGMDHKEAKIAASYAYAASARRKQRIYPSPEEDD